MISKSPVEPYLSCFLGLLFTIEHLFTQCASFKKRTTVTSQSHVGQIGQDEPFEVCSKKSQGSMLRSKSCSKSARAVQSQVELLKIP
jgi:hypothetical protein